MRQCGIVLDGVDECGVVWITMWQREGVLGSLVCVSID